MARQKLWLNVVFAAIALLCVGVVGTYIARKMRAKETQTGGQADHESEQEHEHGTASESESVRISVEAQKNLGLSAAPLKLATYFRKVDVPGVITDRPGVSDRGVVAPLTGIVTKIHVYPGSTVASGEPLFSLRLVSDSLQSSQLELFKSTKEIEIARQEKQRLEGLASNGTVAGSRIIDIDNQIKRMDVNVQAYRQDLLSRGLPPEQIDAIAQGHFVTEIEIRAPSAETSRGDVAGAAASQTTDLSQHPFRFEMKLLKVELGQQVESGEVLCTLADHRMLLIEGRGFKKDMPLIQDAARKNFPIQVVFEVSEGTEWPPLPTELHISHVANVIDLESRTFGFYLPLENQWQTYAQDGQERLIWRFRPGDRVRLLVAVEQMDNVFALPQAAVVRDGPEAYAFRQNGDLFDRVSIHVLYEDSASIVFANEGRVREGAYFVQNSAASLNRVLKAQLASGQPANVHVHADGTVHTH